MESHMRVRVCAVVLVALAPMAAAADGHVGAWVTQVQGQRHVLMLNADGTAARSSATRSEATWRRPRCQ